MGPNDLKISDAMGTSHPIPSIGYDAPGVFGCINWLGVVAIPDIAFLMVLLSVMAVLAWASPWPTPKTWEAKMKKAKQTSWAAIWLGAVLILFQIAATFGWIKLSASPWTIRMITSRQIKQEPQQTAQSLSKPDETHSLPLHGSADESTLR